AIAMRPFERRLDSTRQRNMVVLDEHAIGEIKSVILASAATHRIFVQNTKSRRGFAGIENRSPGSRYSIHEFSRERCDPAQPLQEIQDHALAREHNARIVSDDRDLLSPMQPHAIENLRMAGDLVMRNYGAVEGSINIENPRNAPQPCEDAILFGKNGSGGALAGINAGIAGCIP